MSNFVETSNREEAIKYKFELKECFLGEPEFYKKIAVIALPMIAQNTLSNIVGLLDNVMVGQVGKVPMSAVAIVNQILFIFYLCIWGSLAGAGIFSTQFFGKGDMDGVRHSLRFKLVTAITLCTVAVTFLYFSSTWLISGYISADVIDAERVETLKNGIAYLNIMLLGLLPFSLTQVYASAMRESGNTKLPMVAVMVAMVVNFIFNALLIFGLMGFPKMGVLGAAVATVISRFVELSIVVFGAHRKGGSYTFFDGLYKGFYIPREMILPMLSKTLPLLCNEFLWSFSQALLLKQYAVRGLSIIAAINISGTVAQIFNEVFLSIGGSTAIIVGQELGANKLISARRTAWRMAALSVASTIVMGLLLAIAAPFIPQIYNVDLEIKALAMKCILVIAVCMPINAYANVTYFTIRSGGKTLITFAFDFFSAWFLSVPVAYVLCRHTALPIVTVYLIVGLLELVKCVVGFFLVKSGIWVRNIVVNEESGN
ncbi:MAG: MATE family efflux transporter [Butyrivibrio sp.]|nr:MATE family efflux transporter [Butyrivibrio sp.]